MNSMEKNFVIIDGNSLINRAYFAIQRPMVTKEGIYTQGIYGFLNMLEKIKKMYTPELIGVAFDVKAKTFRHNMFDGYKSGRKSMDVELAMQLPILKDVLKAMNIKTVELEGFEADDLIGTLAKQGEAEGFKSLIITGDKDALQLVTENTEVIFTKKGISEFVRYDEKTFEDEYNFPPKIMIDYKSLFGDKSDNIPGVAGIGDVTAKKLLWEYKDLDNIYENIESIKSKSVKSKLENGRIDAYMSKKLATINTSVPMDLDLNEYKSLDPDMDALIAIYRKLEFNSFLNKMGKKGSEIKEEHSIKAFEKIYVDENNINELLASIPEADSIGMRIIDSEEEKEKLIREDSLVGFLIGEKLFATEKNSMLLNEIFSKIEEAEIPLFGHQLRNEVVLMMEKGIKHFNIVFDTAIALYLIDSNRSDYSLEKSATTKGVDISLEARETQLSFDGKSSREDVDKQLANLEKQFSLILDLMDEQKQELDSQNMNSLFEEVELPLIEVMAFMQYQGMKLDQDKLNEIGDELKAKINKLTDEIYSIAGEEFNINSPRQLGVILFEKMELKAGKKTKTGYSTNAETLEKIRDDSPIIPAILEYRKLNKLVTTYIDGLIAFVHEDGKIHSQFNQTVASTGRLSSSNPNMQNIPIRDEAGKKIRGAFIPEDGYSFTGADYSQIELRVLAHMSGDEALIESFNNGEDIHRATAARVMGIAPEDVTSSDRSNAKAINFGVIYGMGAFSLSEDLNISWQDAEKYINDYFSKHEKVKLFMEAQKQLAKEKGYVETILKRKRYIPEINAKNMIVKQQGNRLAMNTPIQGSAADIIKLAMIKVYNALKGMKSRLILQVHDELIIETFDDEKDQVAKLLKEAMESAIKLKVDLKVDLNTGDNWLALK